MSTIKTVRLGDEYDDSLREALVEVLRSMSGQSESREWGLAGSQELEAVEVDVNGQKLTVEAETYMGLTITGESALVEDVSRRVVEVMERRGRK